MKTIQSIASKVSIASLTFMMAVGSSIAFAAEHQSHSDDSEKGPRSPRFERRGPQSQEGDHEGRGKRGGPRLNHRQSDDTPFQARRMGNRPSTERSERRSSSIQRQRGPQQFGNQQSRQGRGGSRQRAMNGRRQGHQNFESPRRHESTFQGPRNMGASRFSGRMMSRRGTGGIQNRRFGRAMAMRQMALRFRGEEGHPFMRGDGRFQDQHRGPDVGHGKSRFKQGSRDTKGKGRHQDLRGRKGKGSKQSAVKGRGSKKDRSAKNKKGIQNRRGGKKEGKAKGHSSRRNRNRHS